jgi:hypothetical protein
MPGARSRLGARGIPGSAISIAASTPISSAWRPRGAMAVCAFPIHVRRMGTCGRAAAGDKPAVAFGQTPRNRHEWECGGDGEGHHARDRDPTAGRPREYGKKKGCRKYHSSIRVLVFALLSGTAVP